MNPNGVLYRLISIFLGANLMSFAWPLRGQFGHEWGALITGAMAGICACVLIPWKNFRQVFIKGVFFGALGFMIGGENVPYGRLLVAILAMPDLKTALPDLMIVFFIGASWGCVGATYLGYGISEKPVSRKEYVLLAAAGGAALLLTAFFDGTAGIMIIFTALILALHFYNLKFKQSRMVSLMGFYGFAGFGLGFFIAAVILFYGEKGWLEGPAGWWTLRDQIWGGLGGLGLMTAAWKALDLKAQPLPDFSSKAARLGFLFFIPFICGWNTYDVYEKWFMSSPPAPDLKLAGILIAAGVLLLAGAAFYFLRLPETRFISPALNPVILGSSVFFSVYITFFALAKSILYSGWQAWEMGFTLFLFELALLLTTLPFILLGPQTD